MQHNANIMEALPAKILIVDDEADITELLAYSLSAKGYHTETARDGVEALRKARDFRPDLILLDVMMPRKSGLETLRDLRGLPEFENTAILFLTAMSDEKSEIEGLRLGADDYISKPIKPELLATRIAAALRRTRKEETPEKTLHFGDLQINRTRFTVTFKAEDLVLAKKEFELLYLLASSPGRVFERTEILQRVWGTDVIVGDRTIDVHIRKIRQKTGLDLITTVKGVGYKFNG